MPNFLDKLLNTVMLFSKTEINLDTDVMRQALEKQFTQVEFFSKYDIGTVFITSFPDYMVSYHGQESPVQLIILQNEDATLPPEHLAPYIEQTRDWDEAEAIVTQCSHNILVADLAATELDRPQRMEFFHKAMTAILDVIPCDVMAWRASQQLIDPQGYLQSYHSDKFDPLYGILNVRIFRMPDTEPEQIVMDTLGMAIFELPDIQCRFVKLDPSKVTGLLLRIARSIYDHGDVIQDGETVQGLKPDDKWRCQHEIAQVAPKRVVLDIHPDDGFTAGSRS